MRSPLVLLHGFADCWRTWDLVLPALERHHDVHVARLPGHYGGPPLESFDLASAVEAELDARGWETAHIVGNSLGGYLALQLAARGRARTVVALAPGGGWALGDESFRELLDQQRAGTVLPVVAHPERVPPDLLAELRVGVARCSGGVALVDNAVAEGFAIDAEHITCPVRVIWGAEDRVLPWPAAAARYRTEWVPQADWVVLEDTGHAPHLDTPLETAQLILGVTGS